MFYQRLFVVIFLTPLVGFIIYLGGWLYLILGLLVLLVATYEYSKIMQAIGWKTPLWLLFPAVLVQLLAGQWSELGLAEPFLAFSFFICMVYGLWLHENEKSQNAVTDWFASAWGILLLGWLGSHFFRLRALDVDMIWQWTLLTFVANWASDIFAYVVGRFFTGKWLGRHQLTPKLSPNKTVEGYVAGVLLGTLFSCLLAYLMQLPLLPALFLTLIISVSSVFGDLGISLLKRVSGVKDSGQIIPGHGGILDRFDNLFWTIAIGYYFVIFFVAR